MAAAVPANSSDGMGNGLAVATWRVFFWGRSGVLWRRLGGGGMGTGGGGDNDPCSDDGAAVGIYEWLGRLPTEAVLAIGGGVGGQRW